MPASAKTASRQAFPYMGVLELAMVGLDAGHSQAVFPAHPLWAGCGRGCIAIMTRQALPCINVLALAMVASSAGP